MLGALSRRYFTFEFFLFSIAFPTKPNEMVDTFRRDANKVDSTMLPLSLPPPTPFFYSLLLQFSLCRFQTALKKYGVPEEEIFQTADLYERRNIPQVTLCLYALSRLVCRKCANERAIISQGVRVWGPSRKLLIFRFFFFLFYCCS